MLAEGEALDLADVNAVGGDARVDRLKIGHGRDERKAGRGSARGSARGNSGGGGAGSSPSNRRSSCSHCTARPGGATGGCAGARFSGD